MRIDQELKDDDKGRKDFHQIIPETSSKGEGSKRVNFSYSLSQCVYRLDVVVLHEETKSAQASSLPYQRKMGPKLLLVFPHV
jgi:hypothetical protein